MLSAEQYQHMQTTLDDLAGNALAAWIDAKTLAERTPGNHDAQVLAGQLQLILAQARGVAAVLRDEGQPT